jgi:glycosyltransferase involved in cell wall biosynthesis
MDGTGLRIAYLSCDFGVSPAGANGSAVHVRETVSALRASGHTVRVFSPVAREGTDGGAEDVSSVPLSGPAASAAAIARREEDVPRHVASELRSLLYAEYAQRALLPELMAFRPDVIYERYALFAYAGVSLGRVLDAPLLLEVNAPLSVEQGRHRELALVKTAQELERSIWTGADAVVAVSRAVADHARTLGVPDERVHELPNGVDPERFNPSMGGGAARARLGLDGEDVVGFVGSLKAWHDIGTLIDATILLNGQGFPARLLVVGDGPEAERLAGQPHVTHTGSVPSETVPEYLSAMDAVVVPYSSDQQDHYFSPLKLMEAMAMARPVVAARAGQPAEIITDGTTGVLYEPGNAADLACKLRDILARPDRGSAMGSAARRQVLNTHTWERNASRITDLARALLEQRRSRA